jgi:hypothetical protein
VNLVSSVGFRVFINWFCSVSHLGISDFLMFIGLKLLWNYLFLGV